MVPILPFFCNWGSKTIPTAFLFDFRWVRFRINRTYWNRQTDFSNIQIKYVPRGFGLTKPNSGICYADDWPQFRGPNRDGKSVEIGLLKKCPEVPYQASSDTSIITPVYKNGYIYVTSVVEREFKRGSVMLELSADGTSVAKKWNDQTLDCGHGGVVLVDGYLYGLTFDGIPKGDWICLDWGRGKLCTITSGTATKARLFTPMVCCTIMTKIPVMWLWLSLLRSVLK